MGVVEELGELRHGVIHPVTTSYGKELCSVGESPGDIDQSLGELGDETLLVETPVSLPERDGIRDGCRHAIQADESDETETDDQTREPDPAVSDDEPTSHLTHNPVRDISSEMPPDLHDVGGRATGDVELGDLELRSCPGQTDREHPSEERVRYRREGRAHQSAEHSGLSVGLEGYPSRAEPHGLVSTTEATIHLIGELVGSGRLEPPVPPNPEQLGELESGPVGESEAPLAWNSQGAFLGHAELGERESNIGILEGLEGREVLGQVTEGLRGRSLHLGNDAG